MMRGGDRSFSISKSRDVVVCPRKAGPKRRATLTEASSPAGVRAGEEAGQGDLRPPGGRGGGSGAAWPAWTASASRRRHFLFSKGRRRCSRAAASSLLDSNDFSPNTIFAAFSGDESDTNGSNLFYTKQSSVMMGRFARPVGFIESRRTMNRSKM